MGADEADDLVEAAIEELYSVDPDDFMQRRTELAKQARQTDRAAAAQIAALRKPTRSAYALNQLVRSDPEAAGRLAQLGSDLRAAQESLDGARMRELSTLRRGMVEELADLAFHAAEQRSPAPGLRDEVISTLNAAVADESVVAQLGSATLVKAARWDGFGFASPPELSVVGPTGVGGVKGKPTERPSPSSRAAAGRSKPTKPTKATKATKATKGELRAAEAQVRAEARAEAKAEEQHQRRVRSEARQVVRDADAALTRAGTAEEEQQTRVRHLHEQLTDARRRLDEMRIDLRRAENRQRKAQQALERLER